MLEKSRAILHPDLEIVMSGSSLPIVIKMFPKVDEDVDPSARSPRTPTPRSRAMAPTVAAQCCAQVRVFLGSRKSIPYHRPPNNHRPPQIFLSSRALKGKRRGESRTPN